MAHARKTKDESGQMVLLNSQGETVRTFRFGNDEDSPSAKLVVVYRHDTRRIEPHYDTRDLETSGVTFDVLGETSQKELRIRPLQIGKVGSLAWNDGEEETVLPPSFDLNDEDDKKDLVLIGKWVGGAQVVLIAFVLILGHFLQAEKPPEDVTTIRAVKLEKLVEKPPVVQMAEKPVKKVVQHVQPKVVKKVVQHKPTPRIVTRHAPKVQTKRTVTARVPKTAPAVENMGALGALGGLSKLKQSGGGLNLSGASLARGQDAGAGGGGVGRGGAGGVSGALFGKGLIAASNGSGARAGSAGGYGTKGKGGGRQGYGTHNMAGASGGYVAPLDNESFVEGGLTRDQVDEVIQRNKGQIRYCYEKGLQGSPGLKGRVSINFVIGSSGHVSTAHVQQSSVDSSTLEGCVVAKLKNFKFPQPVGGVNVQVRYPFSFSRDLAAN
ncbi:hypothetical protein BH10BDE1_BH10BDE1_34140 [soil metagenome]